MNKSALVAEVAKRTDRGKSEVALVLEATLEVIRRSVAAGEKVTLVGFGTFERRRRNRRVARNPRQPEVTVTVPAREVPAFIPGAAFRDAVATTRTRRPRTGSSRTGTSRTGSRTGASTGKRTTKR